ncbi:MAG TPA: hypothetical protein VE980_18430 [Pyrinomonadaceae bacterium]|nr:hypothetical protein [Pyrinomonadaceae bacterium]
MQNWQDYLANHVNLVILSELTFSSPTLWTFSQQLRKLTHNHSPELKIISKIKWHVACACRGGFGYQEEKRRLTAMSTDERDILELLKDELDFIEKGGYGRSVRTPWQSKSTFQDSLSCINYGYPYRAHPCNECHLLDFVSPENRTQEIPCHFIPLNTDGDTIEDLELRDDQAKLERKVSEWLRTKIEEIEKQRA